MLKAESGKEIHGIFLGRKFNSESLGIIGLGNIGKEVAKRAVSFGLKVYYNNRNKLNHSVEKLYNVRYLSFQNIIQKCKYIVLLLPLTKSSKYLFTEKILKNEERFFSN